jgi:hypothetical protein
VNNYKYNFNFCAYANNPCIGDDTDADDSFGFRKEKTGGVFGSQCVALSDSSLIPDKVISIPDNHETNTARHIFFTLEGGEECDNKAKSSISFEIFCDKFATGRPQSFSLNESDKCNPIITFTHASGCPYASLNSFAAFIASNPWVIALFFIVIGPVIAFKGRKFFPWVVGTVSGLVTFFALMFFCSIFGLLDYANDKEEGSMGALLFAIIFSLGVAIFIGWVMMKKFLMIGFMILGGLAGFFVGGLLFNLLLVQWMNDAIVLYISTFGFALLGAYLAYKMTD